VQPSSIQILRDGPAVPGYHINRSNLLVLESKADMQKPG
jgi:hypothetical protein